MLTPKLKKMIPTNTIKTAGAILQPTTIGTGLSTTKTGNKMYDDLFSANPYANLTYKKSGWQNLLSKLGFRTDADRWLEEAQVNSAEYDAQVASIMQQNEYNSEANKVAMMKEAGLNPDLLGTNGVSESASPITDPNGMSPNLGDEFGQAFEKVSNFASGIMSMFQIGMGFAKDMLSYRQMKAAVDGQDVKLAKEFMGFANDYVLERTPAVPFTKGENFDEHILSIKSDLREIPKFLKWNRRQRRVWNQVTSRQYFNSREFKEMTKDWLESSENADKYTKTNRNFGGIAAIDEWKAFNDLTDELGDLAKNVWKSEQTRMLSVNEFTEKLHKELNASAQAGATNAQNKLASQTSTIEKQINSTMSRIVNKLEQDANGGDMLASGLLLAMNIFRMSNFQIGSNVAKFGLKGF